MGFGVKSSRGARGFRFLLALLLVLTAAALAFAAVAGADAISPEAGPTKNATDTDTLYKIVFIMGAAVVGLVWAILFYSLVRFRGKRGRLAPQIRGNATLEIGWTVAASAIVVTIAIITFFFLGGIRGPQRSGPAGLAEASSENAAINQPPPAGGKALNIKVAAQQYFWRYQYPNGAVSFHDMVVPRDTTVTLDISSNDVAHSWWIPKLGGKQDALRGLTNQTWFKATRTGEFEGQCAELCGANHAFMTAKVVVVEPNQYQQWVQNQKQLIQQSQKEVLKQKKLLESKSEQDG